MTDDKLKSFIEGVIFAQSEPVAAAVLANLFGEKIERVRTCIGDLRREYDERARGFVLAQVAEGFQFRTLPEVSTWLLELRKKKPAKLSRATLEALTIIAYNQPITRNEIEQIRGVESSAALRTLVERELIVVVGKKPGAGRPLLYGTTKRFLEVFQLKDLASLPPLPALQGELEQLKLLEIDDIEKEDRLEEL